MFGNLYKRNISQNFLDLETSQQLFFKVFDNRDLIEKIKVELGKNQNFYNALLFYGRNGNWRKTLKKTPFQKLCVTFAYLPHIYEKYRAEGIDDDIFFDTFSDIKVWIADYYNLTQQYGLDEFNWILNHLNFEIFKIGRLQYQMTRYFCVKPYKCEAGTFSAGTKILSLHIPRGGKLDIAECEKSFLEAKQFFAKHFPKYSTDVFFCYSWLLHSSAKNYMRADSNIIKFAQLFDIIEEKEAPNQAYRWLFSKIIKDAPYILKRKKSGAYFTQDIKPLAKTSLQKSALCYIENGGVLGDAFGALIPNFVETKK